MAVRIDFFESQDAAGNSPEKIWEGGPGIFSAVAGTWNSATVKLQAKGPDKATWVDITGLVLSANGFLAFEASKHAALRAVVTGTPTDLYAAADQSKAQH